MVAVVGSVASRGLAVREGVDESGLAGAELAHKGENDVGRGLVLAFLDGGQFRRL